jgi:hypothetical protein
MLGLANSVVSACWDVSIHGKLISGAGGCAGGLLEGAAGS